ncbi:MAG: DUF6804 family protein [Coriobacteriia bacterium]
MSDSKASSSAVPVVIVVALLVFVGLGDMPYGYYMLLRFVTCGVSLYLLFGASLQLEPWHRWVLGALAVLYNPIVPVHLMEKSIWIVVNIVTVVMFWIAAAAPKVVTGSGRV